MTDLDELIREVLTTDAQTQLQPDGLTERSMRLGRRLRQRRRLAFASAALGSVAVIVAGSLAISDASNASSRIRHGRCKSSFRERRIPWMYRAKL